MSESKRAKDGLEKTRDFFKGNNFSRLNLYKTAVKLFLPDRIYAVVDMECNVYYDNIVTVMNSSDYVFDVRCEKGRNDAARWRFTPSVGDVGEYDWTIRVIDRDNNVVADGKTHLSVSSADAGVGRKISFLGISASGFNDIMTHFYKMMLRPGNPELTMIGTNYEDRPKGAPPTSPIRHEAYGGWGWHSFLDRFELPTCTDNNGMYPEKPLLSNSPFLRNVKGKPALDFKWYFREQNGGKAADIIVFSLGINDFFRKDLNDIETFTRTEIFPHMDKLIGAIMAAAPKALIGIATMFPCAHSQDAFGANYGCFGTKWDYRLKLDIYNRLVYAHLAKFSPRISFIPLHSCIDTVNGFPTELVLASDGNDMMVTRQANALHPSTAGSRQFAACVYGWLKYHLGTVKNNIKK